VKLLVDMNLSPRWVKFLSAAGFEAVHWSSLGDATAPDTEIMSFAAGNDYIVLTHDLDFGAILAATRGGKPSVVQLRAGDLSPERLGTLVITGLRKTESELVEGALLSIDALRTRVRLLPLSRAP
jgi:predicted nuclease of predicted toxin-antitoxin system